MSISQILQESISWLGWSGLALGLLTLLAFLFKWGIKFRLVGATIFTLLLSVSIWAFQESYSPPAKIEGALFVPIVYDNGEGLVVAQAPDDFPLEAVRPSLEQMAENLKGGNRNGQQVTVRIRKIESTETGINEPKTLGEIIFDPTSNTIIQSDYTNLTKSNEFEKDLSILESLDESTSTEIEEVLQSEVVDQTTKPEVPDSQMDISYESLSEEF